MELVILITEHWFDPHHGGSHTHIKEFRDLNAAQDYLRECRCIDEKSGGMQDTTIQIVERYQPKG